MQLLNAYSALANGGTLYAPHVVGETISADGTVTKVEPEVIGKVGASASVLRVMRRAARTVVTSGHTFNSPRLPIVIAGKTGTAQFSGKAKNLPFHQWFVAFVPKDPWKSRSDPNGMKAIERTDSELAVVVLAYNSRAKGNAATEMVKYFLQLHFGIKKDYRNFYLMKSRDRR